jgi:catalase
VHLIDKLAKFDRERIPERVVHAVGAGGFGYFQVTHDITKYTKAKFLNKVGKETPICVRFSTTLGERGFSDLDRDPRGFAIKLYTEDGNCDFVCNNTPFFFIRDPIKFPDVIHSRRRNPQTNMRDPNMSWDFISLNPESIQNIMFLFSERGISDGYRHMDGFSAHAYRWVNDQGESFIVKYHIKTDAGIKNLTPEEALKIEMKTKDYSAEDLWKHLESGKSASWTFYIQAMPEKDAETYRYDVTDITKIWPHSDYPLIPVGKFVLNRNPNNNFAEMEQVAFSPGNIVPGIELSHDRILQARVFSYPDTQRHRLGANFEQIPVNCPMYGKVYNYQRDGPMRVDSNGGSSVNYEPNSHSITPKEDPTYKMKSIPVSGLAQRAPFPYHGEDIDFEQPRALWAKVFSEANREYLVTAMCKSMAKCRPDIKERMIQVCTRVHPEFGGRIAKGLGMPDGQAKL